MSKFLKNNLGRSGVKNTTSSRKNNFFKRNFCNVVQMSDTFFSRNLDSKLKLERLPSFLQDPVVQTYYSGYPGVRNISSSKYVVGFQSEIWRTL